MQYSGSKAEVLGTSLILSLTVISHVPAQSASLWWDLEFFDDQGAKIGAGEFSYDPENSENIQYQNPVTRETIITSLANTLDNFSATILGTKWTLANANFRDILWWETNSSDATNSILQTSVGNFLQDNFGFTNAPNSDVFPDEFVMGGNSNATSGKGNWNQTILGSNQETNGTWSANLRDSNTIVTTTLVSSSQPHSVPEPFSIISLIGASLLAFFTHNLGKQKTNRVKEKICDRGSKSNE